MSYTATTSGRYGIIAFGSDKKVTFHSDHSSVVYAGQMSVPSGVSPVKPTYTGDYHLALSSSLRNSNYDMGWITQYEITLDVDYMVPFYCPDHDNQDIAIMDVINEGTKWVVNLLFSGTSSQAPDVYAFAPLSELPSSSVTLNDHGIAIYDSSSKLLFTDSKRPLRIDDVVTISHTSSIKTNSKGTCSTSGHNTNTCHVDFTPNQSNTISGSTTNSANKLYSIVSPAYGGLAYNNSASGSTTCYVIFQRNYSWAYKSWASFRGVLRHPRNTTNHIAGWEADFAGAAHQYWQGDCGFGGWLGALIGAFLVIFTGGAALLVISGALAGFAIGEMTVGTTPSLKAYDTDEVFDTAESANLMITDKTYYGIS